ncbi:unnamed protein product [Bursaphelenchus xylophilus]|uniref:NADH-cytochrome b5 reductase n=1 Tax=Bursaphelenchus xylophilus TaxID=6326 RepID=A0A1I7S5D9_BURXY|nr:unnamed protein product [Bursaphelenchus xylophilus]CAG9117969.1 unnamed protein product [Bursaphelenchus xylophilus]
MVPTFTDDCIQHSLLLIEKTKVSPDSYIFRFELPSEEHVPGLKPHQHVKLHAKIDGEPVFRKMTPITDDDTAGYMDLLIKIYQQTPEYPDGGLFTRWLDTVEVGEDVLISGPIHKVCYEGEGVFSGRKVSHLKGRKFKNIILIAGGTGITPMYQIITHSLKYDKDDINIWLLFANRTTKDVLLKEELDKLAAENPRFHVWYTVSTPDDTWNYSVGYITKEMISTHLPSPSEDTITLVIGPLGMKKFAVYPALKELGYPDKLVI